MVDALDSEPLAFHQVKVRPQDGRDRRLPRLLQRKSAHGADRTAAHNQYLCLLHNKYETIGKLIFVLLIGSIDCSNKGEKHCIHIPGI